MAVAAAPEAAVVVSRTTAVPRADVQQLADQISGALIDGGVRVMPGAEAEAALADAGSASPATCEGSAACLGRVSNALNVPGVVGVFLNEVLGERTAFLSLVKRNDEQATVRRDFLVVPDQQVGPAELGDFVAASKAVLAQPKVVFAPSPPRDHTNASLVAGASAATLVAGIVVGILGVNAKANFDTHLATPAKYTREQLQADAAPANTLPPIGISLAAAAAVLGGVAVWLW